MSKDHADTIRRTIRHDRMRVVDTWEHPKKCWGCAAERELDALLAENSRLNVSEASWAAQALEAQERLKQVSEWHHRAEQGWADAVAERQQAQEEIASLCAAIRNLGYEPARAYHDDGSPFTALVKLGEKP